MSINASDLGNVFTDKIGIGSEGTVPDNFLSIKVVGEGLNGRNPGDTFGVSVAISGDYAVVGVPAQDYDIDGENVTTEAGAAYVYKRNIMTWEYMGKLTADTRNPQDNFGASVAISADRLAVGCPGRQSGSFSHDGSIFVFELGAEWIQVAELAPSGTGNDQFTNARFGSSITMGGDYLVAGTTTATTNELGTQSLTNAGAAWIFYRNPDTKSWSQVQKLHAQGNDRNANDYFGKSTSGFGNKLAVGIPGFAYSGHGTGFVGNGASGAGAVDVFDWDATNLVWKQEARLFSATRNAGDQLGTVVELGQDIVVAYAPMTSGVGRVSIFEFDAQQVIWTESTILNPVGYDQTASTVGTAAFGSQISISGDTVVISAPSATVISTGGSATNSGIVYVYRKVNNTWTLETKIARPGTDADHSFANQYFGSSVAIVDDMMVIGAKDVQEDATEANPLSKAGAAYIYSRTGTVWSLVQKLQAIGQDRNANDNLGQSIAISANVLVVGAPGHSYDAQGTNFMAGAGAVYVWTHDTSGWLFQQKITPTGTNSRTAGDAFGSVLDVDGDTIVVGVPNQGYDALGGGLLTNAGALYVFRLVGGIWGQEAKLVADNTNRTTGYKLGRAVSIEADTITASSLDTVTNSANNPAANAGAVYLFTRSGTTWSEEAVVTAPVNDVTAGDQFGDSVSYNEDILVVGAPIHSKDFDGVNPLTNAGAAWIYQRTAPGTWAFQTKLSGWGQDRNANDTFGLSAAASGTTLVIGAPHHSYDANSRNFIDRAGAIYVYLWNNNAWLFQQKIVPQTRGILYRFGWSVDIDGDQMVVGAPGEGNSNSPNYATNKVNTFGTGAAYTFSRSFGVWTQTTKLTPSGNNAVYDNLAYNVDGQGNPTTPVWPLLPYQSSERFGWSVAIHGDQLIVGQPWSLWDQNGQNAAYFAGEAYIFTRSTANNTWLQESRLTSTNRTVQDYFGWSVDIRDGIAVIGSPYDDTDQDNLNPKVDAGAVFVFRRDLDGHGGYVWTAEQKLVGWGQERNVGDLMGYSVAGDNGTLVVGSPGQPYRDDGNQFRQNAGAVYVWLWNAGTWTFQQKISASGTNGRNTGDMFGQAVAISGDTLIIGAPNHSYNTAGNTIVGTNTGAVWIYTRTAGSWTFAQKISLPVLGTPAQNTNVHFGQEVAINGNSVAIAAPGFQLDVAGQNALANAGGIWIYRNTSGSIWNLEQQVTSPHRAANEQFGWSMSMQDNMLVVGSPLNSTEQDGVVSTLTNFGAAYVFTRAGSTWTWVQKITAFGNSRNPGDNLGYSAAYANGTLIVGAPAHDYDLNGNGYLLDAGAAYLWKWENSAWTFDAKISAPFRSTSARFGHSVAITGDRVVVGAPGHVISAQAVGAAFVFDRDPTSGDWSAGTMLQATGLNSAIAGDKFGWSVALVGDSAVVGAPNHGYDVNGANLVTNAGAAYAFEYISNVWQQGQKLTGFGTNARGANDQFGFGLGVTADWLVIGAPTHDYDESGADPQTDAGAAWVLARDSGTWMPQQKIVGYGRDRNTNDAAGSSIAADGNYLVVGAPNHSYDAGFDSTTNTNLFSNFMSGAGAAYIWSWNGTSWTLEQKVVPSNRSIGAGFGQSVAIESDLVVVGAPNTSSADNLMVQYGSAAAFRRTGTDPAHPWAEEQIFLGDNAAIAPYSHMGSCVAIDSNQVFVSSPGDNRTGSIQFVGNGSIQYGGTLATFAYNDFTVEAWIMPNSIGAQQAIFGSIGYAPYQSGITINDPSNPREWAVFLLPSGQISFSASWAIRYENLVMNSSAALPANQWSHIAITRKAGTFKIYINGTQSGSMSPGLINVVGTVGFQLGVGNYVTSNAGDPVVTTQFFNGSFDGVRITNGQAIYDTSPAVLPPTDPSQYVITQFTKFQLFGETINPKWADDLGNQATSFQTVLRGPSRFNYGIQTGAGGQVNVYTKDTSWSLSQTLVPTGTNANLSGDAFGSSIAVVDDLMVIGAPGQDYDMDGRNPQTNAGAVYLYQNQAGTWVQVQKMIGWGQDSAAGDQFGFSMSGQGTTLAVGAPNHGYNEQGANYHQNGGAVYVWVWQGNPSAWVLQQKISSADITDGAKFGASVSVHTDTLVIGAPGLTTNSVASGGVFVFNRTSGSPGTDVWSQTTLLVPQGPNAALAGDNFGFSVAVQQDSNTLVIGAPNHGYDASGANLLANSGAVWAYSFTGGSWQQSQKLVAGSQNLGNAGDVTRVAGDQFGYSIDIRDNVMVIGAPLHDYDELGRNPQTDAGAAYLYTRTNSTSSWTQLQKLAGAGNERGVGDNFGWAVAGDGLTLAVSAPNHAYDGQSQYYLPGAGAVWVWTYADNQWSFQQKISAQDGPTNTNRNANDHFGKSLSLSGETMAIGAPNYDGPDFSSNMATDGGAVFIFTRSSSVWSLQAKIVPTGTINWNPGDLFGSSVALDGDTVAIGSPMHSYSGDGLTQATNAGAGYIYRRDGSNNWNLEAKITPTGTNQWNANDQFGTSVSLKNNVVVWGAPNHGYDQSGSDLQANAGAAFVYRRTVTTWVFEDAIMAWNLTRQAGDNLSKSMAADGSWLIVGAPNHDYDANSRIFVQDSGAAYLFQLSGNSWNYFQKISPPDSERFASDLFGSAVAISGTTAVVASNVHNLDSLDANPVTGAGAVWTFDLVNSVWTLGQKLTPDGTNARNANDNFGTSLDISGDIMVVGAPNHAYDEFGQNEVDGSGAAWIFERSAGQWIQTQKAAAFGTNARNVNDAFGSAVSIENTLVAIGAPNHGYDADGNNFLAGAGAVWFLDKSSGSWVEAGKSELPGQDRRTNDNFGSKVKISGNIAAIGQGGTQTDAKGRSAVANAGAVQLFTQANEANAPPMSATLNGVSDYIKLDNAVAGLLNSDFTWASWIRIKNSTSTSAILSSSRLNIGAAVPTGTSFSFTGAQQTFTVPSGVTQITAQLWGASGGAGQGNQGTGITAAGGYTSVVLNVNPGDTIRVDVGGGGKGSAPYLFAGATIPGGWPDGGAGGTVASGSNTVAYGGGGGGSSRVWINGVIQAVAGGSGGGLNSSGSGGGLNGGTLTISVANVRGGTQTAGGNQGANGGGSFMQGGNSQTNRGNGGGGGGGGYYGGGAGGSDPNFGGTNAGAGGSGYIGGASVASGTTLIGGGNQGSGSAVPAVTTGAPANTGVGVATGASGALNGNDGYVILSYNQQMPNTFQTNFDLYTDSTGQLFVQGINTSGVGETFTVGHTTITDNNWHHLAVTFTKSTNTFVFYLDGTPIKNLPTDLIFAALTSSDNMSVGQVYTSSMTTSNFLGADFYDMAVWNRALISSEVTQVYSTNAGLVALAYLQGNWIVQGTVPVWNTPAALGTFQNTQVINMQLSATDPGGQLLTYSLTSGNISSVGLSLSGSGLLSGTINGVNSNYSFVARATNTGGNYIEQTFTFTIATSDANWTNVVFLANGES